MSKFFSWAVVAAVIVALTCSPTFAANKKKKKGDKSDKVAAAFKKLDANKDGSVSLDEFKTAMEKKAEKKKEKKKK